MGTLREAATAKTQALESDHPVGRSVRNALCIPDRRVSSQHAVIRWTGTGWEVKDLGSRNGTFLGGERLKQGVGCRLAAGMVLAFGTLESRWELADDSPPDAMIVPIDGGEPIRLLDGLCAVPSPEDPQGTLYRAGDGRWLIEVDGERSPVALRNQQTFDLGGRVWRFSVPEEIWRTSLTERTPVEVRTLRLDFVVSRDEEHVQVSAAFEAERRDLGARSRHYLLLTLARRRLEDASRGFPEVECGWTDQEDLARDPSMSGPQLNIDVFRIRRQFAGLDVSDPANIIERRPRTKQLRIGTGQIDIKRA
jgi:hypothetical protein